MSASPLAEPRVVTVPLNSPKVTCLTLAFDETGHCVAWAEVPSDEARAPIEFALRCVLNQHCPQYA